MAYDYTKITFKAYKQEKLKALSKVIPSPFFIDRGIYSKDVVAVTAARVRIVTTYHKRGEGEFSITHNMIYRLLSRITNVTVARLIGYIGEHLSFNTNKIVLNHNDVKIKNIIKDKKDFYKTVEYLENFVYLNDRGECVHKGIICRTTKPHIYVVNHEILFKGTYDDFVTTYINNYNQLGVIIDNKGRVVLDKNIKYE